MLRADEQEGGDLRTDRQMAGFQNSPGNCQLIDMGFPGNKFTQATTHGERIKVRLDRAMANKKWLDLFSKFRVVHLNPTSSDHVPIQLDWLGRKNITQKKMFRYKEEWTTKKGCVEVVRVGWSTE